MADEKVFFDHANVKVTNSRFIVGNQTHAMNGVTSVESHRHSPSRVGLIIGVAFGLLLMTLGSWGSFFLGLFIAAACGYALYKQKATHVVVLRSSSGETEALTSRDEDYIRDVVSALNDSIVYRS